VSVLLCDDQYATDAERAAYAAGQEAAREGKDCFDNPYPYSKCRNARGGNELHFAWWDGFQAGEEGEAT
jgi:hypothetical protein